MSKVERGDCVTSRSRCHHTNEVQVATNEGSGCRNVVHVTEAQLTDDQTAFLYHCVYVHMLYSIWRDLQGRHRGIQQEIHCLQDKPVLHRGHKEL